MLSDVATVGIAFNSTVSRGRFLYTDQLTFMHPANYHVSPGTITGNPNLTTQKAMTLKIKGGTPTYCVRSWTTVGGAIQDSGDPKV